MPTTSQNTQTRHQLGFLRSAIDATVNAGAINAGDLVYSTGNGVASLGSGLSLNAALVAQIGKILGVSKDQNPLKGGITNPLSDIGIYQFGEFAMNTTAADVYTHLAPVTVGADAQTIRLAPVGPDASPAGLFTAGAVSGGTLTAANHVVTMTFITALGETTPGVASAPITATAGQGLVYDYDNASAVVIPSWAVGFAVYVDGVFATAYFAAPAADANITGQNVSNPKPAPALNALAIGYAYMPLALNPGGTQTASITGAAGVQIGVRLNVAASKIDGLI